ncbi:Protein of unknown function [Gryllus bimaculatus]|nr:Protein of unknown function [Gryllus bimaculatus]
MSILKKDIKSMLPFNKPLFQQVYDENMIEYSEENAENFVSETVVPELFVNDDSETSPQTSDSENEVEMTSNATSKLASHPIKHEENNEQDGNIDINNISILRSVEEPSLTKYWNKKYVKSLLALGGSLLLLSFITVIIFVVLIT